MLTQWKAGMLVGDSLTETWNILIQYYALRGDVANSRRLYREMVDNKIPLDNITFGSLMRSLIEIKQTNAAYKILRVTLPANNLRVEAIHYAIVMTGFLREGQYDLALEAYERMVERNVSQTLSSRQASINTVGMSELVRLLKAKNSDPQQHLRHVERLLRDMLASSDVGRDIANRQPSHNRYIDAQTQSAVPPSYYGLLITLYNTRGAYKICKDIVAKADASKDSSEYDAPIAFLTAIMETHYRAQEWDDVAKCWELALSSASKLVKTFQQIMNPPPEPPESPSLTDGIAIQRFEESRIAVNRRQALVKAARIYIRSLINRDDPSGMLLKQAQITIRDLLVNGFVLDTFTWNEYVVALAEKRQLLQAFTVAETYLMPRFPAGATSPRTTCATTVRATSGWNSDTTTSSARPCCRGTRRLSCSPRRLQTSRRTSKTASATSRRRQSGPASCSNSRRPMCAGPSRRCPAPRIPCRSGTLAEEHLMGNR